MGNKNRKILTIVVTYNGDKWIEKCIESLQSSIFSTDIYIVDNGSVDNTVSVLKKYHDIILHESKINLGFGQANNIGLKYALENEYDYVFLLNQDAWVEEDTLGVLCAIADNNIEYGILSPMHFFSNENKLEFFFSTRLSPYYCKNILSDFIVKEAKEMKDIYSLNFVHAAAWFLPIKIFKEIGGFDPLFFHYGEDNNYCHRLVFHGYKIGITPKTKIYHDCKTQEEILISKSKNWKLDRIVLDFKVKYADLNLQIKYFTLYIEVLKCFCKGIVSLIKFDIKRGGGYLSLAIYCFKSINAILRSRFINRRVFSNYL